MVLTDGHRQTQQQVFILHTYPFKETSLVVEMFSRQFGRVAAVAKGARRPASAMRGMLQSFQLLLGSWSGKHELKTLHGLEWHEGLMLLRGEALMCGFYMNELLLRLLSREDAHEALFDYYSHALVALSLANQEDKDLQHAALSAILRKFELKLLQELGYAVPLLEDEHGQAIIAAEDYRYEAEYGASVIGISKNGVKLSGQTLLDMAKGQYKNPVTLQQSKYLMRYLLAHYLGDKPLHTRQLLIDLQGF